MALDDDARLAAGLADLLKEAESIYRGLPGTLGGQMGFTGGLAEQIQKWITRAKKLGSEVKATDVSITAGIPFGLSVTVGFTLPKGA